MSIIKSVKDYLSVCPLLLGSEININYLSQNPGSFAIDNVEKNPIVKRYVGGETIRQFCFLLSGRIVYDKDAQENMAVANFFEEFCAWIDAQNEAKNLPDLKDTNKKPISLEITKSGAIRDTARTSARIELELRLIYRQRN